ncbi:MAG TPA: ABC transporter permease subunit [Galbitalea sp.]|jgi:iron(III) transport system permease protein|nr:ABC transporter permease subunit [Galbitalea sp.]
MSAALGTGTNGETSSALPPGLGRRSVVFRVVVLVLSLAVGALLLVAIVRLAWGTVEQYGIAGIPRYYIDHIFGNPAIMRTLLNTVIVVPVSCVIATFAATILAWLNERTEASLGGIGRVLPLVPFLMPALSLPLGWVFLASPQAGILNVLIRNALALVGVHLESGPFDIFSWPGLIFLYSLVLCGFSYMVMNGAMRNLNDGLEEAAKMAGAGPLKILFRIVIPALRPALFSALFMSLIVGLVMVAVPEAIGTGANIQVLSVLLVNLVTAQSVPSYGSAFLIGSLLLIPIVVLWLVQRRIASGGRVALIGGRSSNSTHLRLGGRSKVIGRIVFFAYVAVGVVLPLASLIYVAGVDVWSSQLSGGWSILAPLQATLSNGQTGTAIFWSVVLGLGAAVTVVVIAHVVSYGQRLFPRFGGAIDALMKSPSMVAQILLAIALLVTFGGTPFYLSGTAWILFLGYIVVFLPFASIMTTAGQQVIGKDLIEAARMAGAGDGRTFVRIVTPLTSAALVGAFLLMYELSSGETNISLILASPTRPVAGYVMLDLFNYGSYPQVAAFSIVVTAVNLLVVVVVFGVVALRTRSR